MALPIVLDFFLQRRDANRRIDGSIGATSRLEHFRKSGHRFSAENATT
jgi:hypothetical protein